MLKVLRKNLLFLLLLSLLFTISCNSGIDVVDGKIRVFLGYPSDFPILYDQGGLGSGQKLTGFGGNHLLSKSAQRAIISLSGKRPVILLHGNSGSATKKNWGPLLWRRRLILMGYSFSHIWAVSYLGENNEAHEEGSSASPVHCRNIAEVREFIDAVLAYTGADKVDIIGHSLGAGMARSYICGLDTNNTFKATLERNDKVGTVVLLSGLNKGCGYLAFGTNTWAHYRNGSTWLTTCDAKEAGYSTRYVSAYTKWDTYEYYYKDQVIAGVTNPAIENWYWCGDYYYDYNAHSWVLPPNPYPANPARDTNTDFATKSITISGFTGDNQRANNDGRSYSFSSSQLDGISELSEFWDYQNDYGFHNMRTMYYHMAIANSNTVWNAVSVHLNK